MDVKNDRYLLTILEEEILLSKYFYLLIFIIYNVLNPIVQ